MMAGQMRQMRVTLNPFSRIVFATGEWMSSHLPLTLAMIGAAVFGVIVFRAAAAGAALRLMGKVPAVARLLITSEMTRFFSVMAAMTRSGVPLADALSTSVEVISDDKLRSQLQQLQKSLVEGGVWRYLIEKVDALPLATRRLLVAAERAGDLDSAFDTLATDMAQEVDQRASRLLAMLEPAVIVLMFALIGPLILAIAIPMLTFRSQVN
jgi:type II secretory pathway component PulF